MRVGNFSVLISEGVEKDSGHVQMQHNQIYGIRLGNHGSVRCDAEVNVDGKHVGTFQMYSGQVFTLERPSHDTGRFTFYKANSEQGQTVGSAEVSTQERGLISVTFRPEKRREREVKTCGSSLFSKGTTETDWSPIGFSSLEGTIKTNSCFPNFQSRGMEAGITALTGQSSQSFHNVPNLDYDPDGTVTISLRLIAGSNEPRRLTPANQGNPIPKPV